MINKVKSDLIQVYIKPGSSYTMNLLKSTDAIFTQTLKASTAIIKGRKGDKKKSFSNFSWQCFKTNSFRSF